MSRFETAAWVAAFVCVVLATTAASTAALLAVHGRFGHAAVFGFAAVVLAVPPVAWSRHNDREIARLEAQILAARIAESQARRAATQDRPD